MATSLLSRPQVVSVRPSASGRAQAAPAVAGLGLGCSTSFLRPRRVSSAPRASRRVALAPTTAQAVAERLAGSPPPSQEVGVAPVGSGPFNGRAHMKKNAPRALEGGPRGPPLGLIPCSPLIPDAGDNVPHRSDGGCSLNSPRRGPPLHDFPSQPASCRAACPGILALQKLNSDDPPPPYHIRGLLVHPHPSPHSLPQVDLSAAPPLSLTDLRDAIPANCWNRDDVKSFAYLVRDVVIVAALAAGAFAANSWALWPLYWYAGKDGQLWHCSRA